MKYRLLTADSIVASSGKGMLWSLSADRRVLIRHGAGCGGMNSLNRADGFEPLSRCAVAAMILTTLGSSKSVERAIGRAEYQASRSEFVNDLDGCVLGSARRIVQR